MDTVAPEFTCNRNVLKEFTAGESTFLRFSASSQKHESASFWQLLITSCNLLILQ